MSAARMVQALSAWFSSLIGPFPPQLRQEISLSRAEMSYACNNPFLLRQAKHNKI